VSDHTKQGAGSPAQGSSLLDRNYFLLRRLHSLSGIVPVGVFVMMHLFTNFQMVMGTDSHGQSHFQHEVDFIHSMPALLFVEIGLWVSIGFHAALGLVYTYTGRSNVQHYRHVDNWRYTLQRITGIGALVFIFLHIATLRWRWDLFGWFTPFYDKGLQGQDLASATTAIALQHGWWVIGFYVLGVVCVVYHWANGLWTAAITWGLTISVAAQKRWGYVCTVIGLSLLLFGLGAIGGAVRYQVSDEEHVVIQQTVEHHFGQRIPDEAGGRTHDGQ